MSEVVEPSSSPPPAPTASSSSATVEPTPETKPQDLEKCDILLKAIGDAPILKKTNWTVARSRNIGWVIHFIKHYFKMSKGESIFLYVNQFYAPAPDEVIDNLYNCFAVNHKLVLYYGRSPAWG